MKAFLPSLHLEHHSEWGMGKVKRRVGLAVGVGCSGMGCSRCSASGFGINCVTPLRQAAGLTGLRASSERVLGAAVSPLQHGGAGGLQQRLSRPALREKLPGAGFPNLLDFHLPALLTKAPRKHKNSPAQGRRAWGRSPSHPQGDGPPDHLTTRVFQLKDPHSEQD